MEETCYIYEIPGVKVGCTNNINRRQKEQISKGEMIIVESHTDIDLASEREREVCLDKGYSWDGSSYKHVYLLSKRFQHLSTTPEARRKAVANRDQKEIGRKVGIAHRKPIDVYTCQIKREGNKRILTNKTFFKQYNSLKQAAEELNLNRNCISDCLRRADVLQHKGYTFEYA